MSSFVSVGSGEFPPSVVWTKGGRTFRPWKVWTITTYLICVQQWITVRDNYNNIWRNYSEGLKTMKRVFGKITSYLWYIVLTPTWNTVLAFTLMMHEDLRPSNFERRVLLFGMTQLFSDGLLIKLKWQQTPCNFKKGKRGIVKR